MGLGGGFGRSRARFLGLVPWAWRWLPWLGGITACTSPRIPPTPPPFDIRYAMERRAAALDMARVMSYEVHTRWMEQLLAERFMEPMAGCQPTTFAQLMAADRELWRQLAEKTGEGVRSRPDGFLPCDMYFPEVSKSRRVDRALTSVQVGGQGTKRDHPSDGAGGGTTKQQFR